MSELSIEELAGSALLVVAVVALAANTGVLRAKQDPAPDRSGVAALARDAEEQRMRLVLAMSRPRAVDVPAGRVLVVGEPCVTVALADDGTPVAPCARRGWPLHPR